MILGSPDACRRSLFWQLRLRSAARLIRTIFCNKPIVEASLSVALGNRFHTRSNNLSEDKLVNICWSLLYCMLLCFMLPGTRGKAVRVCARAFLDRFGTSDLFLVAALRSASRSLLTLSFAEIFVRPFSGSHLDALQTGYWLCQALRLPTSVVPKPRGYLLQNVHLHKKGRGVGSHPLSLFSIGFPAI